MPAPLPVSRRAARSRRGLPSRAVGALALGALLLVVAPTGSSVGPDAATAATIGSGHVDAVAGRIVRGALRMDVKDSSAGSGRVRWRRPSDVTLRVVDRAKVRLPRGLSFVGRAGSTAWLIPQVQRPGIVWAGWSTEALSAKQLRGGLRWTLRGVSGPGRVVIYQTGSFGRASVLFSSARRLPQGASIPLGVHAHGNWAFTKRGTYRLRFALRGTARSGRALTAGGTLRVRVG